jgi:hypothetical protein
MGRIISTAGYRVLFVLNKKLIHLCVYCREADLLKASQKYHLMGLKDINRNQLSKTYKENLICKRIQIIKMIL